MSLADRIIRIADRRLACLARGGGGMIPHDAPLPDDWSERDSRNCFFLGVRLAKEAVERGEPLPQWLRSAREDAAE